MSLRKEFQNYGRLVNVERNDIDLVQQHQAQVEIPSWRVLDRYKDSPKPNWTAPRQYIKCKQNKCTLLLAPCDSADLTVPQRQTSDTLWNTIWMTKTRNGWQDPIMPTFPKINGIK